MRIRFSCDACGARLTSDERSAGKRVKCPQCEHILTVPAPEPSGPPSEPLRLIVEEEAGPVPPQQEEGRLAPREDASRGTPGKWVRSPVQSASVWLTALAALCFLLALKGVVDTFRGVSPGPTAPKSVAEALTVASAPEGMNAFFLVAATALGAVGASLRTGAWVKSSLQMAVGVVILYPSFCLGIAVLVMGIPPAFAVGALGVILLPVALGLWFVKKAFST